jgi:hypothetical protein
MPELTDNQIVDLRVLQHHCAALGAELVIIGAISYPKAKSGGWAQQHKLLACQGSVLPTAVTGTKVERTKFGQNRRRLDGWVLIPKVSTKNEGLNEGLQRVSCRNLQVLRCHPCACKFF